MPKFLDWDIFGLDQIVKSHRLFPGKIHEIAIYHKENRKAPTIFIWIIDFFGTLYKDCVYICWSKIQIMYTD